MFIAIVDFAVAATDRTAALARLDSEREQVRSMPGNLAFRVYAGREDDSRATIVHEWDEAASFDGYLRSRSFAHLGEALRPILVEPPTSRRFRAELLATVA